MSDQAQQGPTVTQSQPADEMAKKKHHHWWQDVPRRLSFTKTRTMSESSEDALPSPTESKGKKNRRFSESSTHSVGKESAAEIRERWNQNYNIPPECFVPPWF